MMLVRVEVRRRKKRGAQPDSKPWTEIPHLELEVIGSAAGRMGNHQYLGTSISAKLAVMDCCLV